MCNPDTTQDNYIQGLAGNNLAQMFVGLQHHKAGLQKALQWAERANRIGWQNAGVDVAKIDQEATATDDEMDSSINIGDTHVQFGQPMAPPTTQQPQQPTPTPQPAPTPPPAPKPNGMPSWAKWLLGAALGASAAGPAITAYVLRPQPAPQQQPGGSIFRFDTELPPWMQDNDAP